MWALMFCIKLPNVGWVICIDRAGKYVKVGGPYPELQGPGSAFEGLATLRGQVVNGVELR